MTVRVGIIGSGPAGLIVALALEKAAGPADAQLTLVDRNRSVIDAPGVEYTLQARAGRALDRLGLKGAAFTVGAPTGRIVLHVMRTGKIQRRIRLDPRNNSEVDRSEFLDNLSKLLRRTEILSEHDVSEIEAREHGRVRLHFQTGVGLDAVAPEPREFDIVIACDGIDSVARRKYFPAHRSFDRGFSAIYFSVVGDPGDSHTPEAFVRVANGDSAEIVLGDRATNGLFSMGRHRLALALAFDHPTGETLWEEHGLSPNAPWQAIPAGTKRAIARTLAQNTPVHDGLMEAAVALVEDWDGPNVYLWRMRDSDPLRHPYAPDCNLVLAGDACHGFLPTIGMGASLAIEDAERLGTRLGQHLRQFNDLPPSHANLVGEVFEPWATERRPVWDDLMHRARVAAQNWRGQSERRRFAISAYVPTRIGSAAVGAVERAVDRFPRKK